MKNSWTSLSLGTEAFGEAFGSTVDIELEVSGSVCWSFITLTPLSLSLALSVTVFLWGFSADPGPNPPHAMASGTRQAQVQLSADWGVGCRVGAGGSNSEQPNWPRPRYHAFQEPLQVYFLFLASC